MQAIKNAPPHGFPIYVAFKIQAFLDFLGVAITAVATIAIAWFTWTLRRSTDRLWEAGVDQLGHQRETAAAQFRDTQESITVTKMAAESSVIAAHAASQSAEVAEQALLASGRPMLLLELLDSTNIGFAVGTFPSLHIRFVNHGSAAAILKVCFIELLERQGPPPELNVSSLERTYQIVGAGQSLNPIELPVKTEDKAQSWQFERAKRLVLHGYLEYGDTLDAVHTHRIYLRLGTSAQTLTEDGGPEYNCRKTSRYEADEATNG